MKSDFLLAITQLSAEKNLPKEVVISAVEAALVSAYRKDNFAPNQNIAVKISPTSGKVQVWADKLVVERVQDARAEIALAEAHRIKPDVKIGESVTVEATPQNAGRIAAQTAKQVILQRLHEAEHSAIMEEYAGREGAMITGLVQRVEPRQAFVDLGRTEAILPSTEQVPNERYRVGQRLKVVILEVVKTNKGPRVIVSRSHPELVRRLFETEVPEIYNGTVEIRSIAREAGSRSKVAVAARQEGVDPVGCCVGLRGIRIQNIVTELNSEKIDVVAWSPEVATFVANSLSPAQIISVELHKGDGVATVVVPDRQLSLAIGKEGQNVRLAAKLTSWRIDIKSASIAEAERAAVEAQKAAAEAERIAAEAAKAETERAAVVEAEAEAIEEVAAEAEVAEEVPAGIAAEPAVAAAEPVFPFAAPPFKSPAGERTGLRFAEDIMGRGAAKGEAKKKKKKKGYPARETEDGVGKRARRDVDLVNEDEEY